MPQVAIPCVDNALLGNFRNIELGNKINHIISNGRKNSSYNLNISLQVEKYTKNINSKENFKGRGLFTGTTPPFYNFSVWSLGCEA